MSMVNPVVPPDVHVARGAHSSPTVGTCLMELVSVIGGERFLSFLLPVLEAIRSAGHAGESTGTPATGSRDSSQKTVHGKAHRPSPISP